MGASFVGAAAGAQPATTVASTTKTISKLRVRLISNFLLNLLDRKSHWHSNGQKTVLYILIQTHLLSQQYLRTPEHHQARKLGAKSLMPECFQPSSPTSKPCQGYPVPH